MQLDLSPKPLPASNPEVAPERKFPDPWLAVTLVIGAFFVATYIAQLLLSIYPALKHWDPNKELQWLAFNTSVEFLFTLLAYALMLVPIVVFLRYGRLKLTDIGLKRPRWRDPGYALLALPIYFISYGIIVMAISTLVPELDVNQKQEIGFQSATSTMDLVLTFLSLAVIPPFAEEFLMRGFLFSSLRARLKMVTAVIITSLVFASGHLQFGSGAPLLWIAALDTFTLSLFLIYLRVKTDSLWASIFLHALKNTVAFVAIFILHKG